MLAKRARPDKNGFDKGVISGQLLLIELVVAFINGPVHGLQPHISLLACLVLIGRLEYKVIIPPSVNSSL
jgi:hypothetical protein